MATDNLDIFIGGPWEKQSEKFMKVADEMAAKLIELEKLGKTVRFNLRTESNSAFKQDMNDIKKSVAEFDAETKKLIATIKAQYFEQQQASKAAQERAKATRDSAKATQEEEKAEAQSWKTMREKNKAIHEQIQQKKKLEAQMAKEEAALKKNQSAYAQLNNTYKQTAQRAQDLGAEIELLKAEMNGPAAPGYTAKLEALEKEFDATAKRGMELHKQLLKIDESVGKSQRNVGNYKSQWNGLNFSIQQMVRAVPSTINNLSMLPLAMSNNVGTFIDNINQARKVNAALAAEGKATIPVWKQVGAAIFSWQTALMAGIALLVAYSSSASTAATKTGDFAEAMKSAGNEYAEAKFQLGAFHEAFKDTTTTMAEKEAMLEEYNDKWGDQAGHLEDVAGLEKFLTEKAGAFVETLFLRAEATAALAAANELLVENMKNQANGGKDLVSGWSKAWSGIAGFLKMPVGGIGVSMQQTEDQAKALKEQNDETTKSVDALQKKYLEFYQQAAAKAKQYGFDLDGKRNKKPKKDKEPEDLTNTIIEQQKDINQAIAEQQVELLGMEADTQKAISENEQLSLEERLAAYNKYYELKGKIDKAAQDKEFAAIDAANDKIIHSIETSTATQEEKDKALTLANNAYAEQISLLYDKYDRINNERLIKSKEDEKKITESSIKEQIRVILEGAQEIESQIKESENRKLELLNVQYEAGLMGEKEYQRQRKEIIANADNDLYKAHQTYFRNYIDELERNGKLTAEVARKIREELAKEKPGNMRGTNGRDDNVFQSLVKSIFGDLEDGQVDQVVGAYAKAFSEIYSSIRTVINNKYAAEIQNLESEMDKIKERYDKEVEYVNSLALTKEEREKRLAELKAQNTLRELEQQRRINEVKRRQARAEKTANIAETVGKTAIAVMNALSVKPWYLGVALAAAAGIAGAAQIAAVSSTPLPQYAKGTKSKPQDGAAVVGELGAELFRKPTGEWGITPDSPTVMDLPKGTEIFTAAQTDRMLKEAHVSRNIKVGKQVDQWVYFNAIARTIDSGNKDIVKAIKQSKPVINMIMQDKAYISRISNH